MPLLPLCHYFLADMVAQGHRLSQKGGSWIGVHTWREIETS